MPAPQSYPYLISRIGDPIFAIFVGVSAYYMSEKKHQKPKGHTLNELFIKRWNKEHTQTK